MFFSALFDSSGPYLASVAPIWLRSAEVTKISLAARKDRLPTKRVSRPPAGGLHLCTSPIPYSINQLLSGISGHCPLRKT